MKFPATKFNVDDVPGRLSNLITNEEVMDIVYILGNGSQWDDNELRYSLRSLEKHFKHRNVFIVGVLPKWLQNIIHIDIQDSFPYPNGGKLKNAVRKIRAACKNKRLSNDFVLMNDDFFFLRDCSEIKPFSLGTIQESLDRHKTKKGYYYKALFGTMNVLQRSGILEPLSYNVHYPFVYNKEKFLRLTAQVDWLRIAYSWRTVYGNIFKIGSDKRLDTKIHNPEDFKEFLKIENEFDFISTTDRVALNSNFQDWIAARFPNKSIYENKH
jgi:hypothetical protein